MSCKSTKQNIKDLQKILPAKDHELYKAAWNTARTRHGYTFSFYLPGMIRYGNERGRYPAISITGNKCELLCEHCKGRLLESMVKITDPDELVRKAQRFAHKGAHGILLSGGSDHEGRLPWKRYSAAIKRMHEKTALHISVHSGFPDHETCRLLKQAGVTQALIDVMGDQKTAKQIYHLKGLKQVFEALKVIEQSGLELVPHIVVGLNYGKIEAEHEALRIISNYRPKALVIVVLTPLKGTPMSEVSPPSPIEIGRLIARARLLMPEVPISLGCERPRNEDGWLMEKLSILAGANRMAVWSEEAIQTAQDLGLSLCFQSTCCSLDYRTEFSTISPDTP